MYIILALLHEVAYKILQSYTWCGISILICPRESKYEIKGSKSRRACE